MTDVSWQTAHVPGVTFRVGSKGTGQPLLYLHDSLSSDWSPFLDHLADRFQVHAVELPGFGASERPSHLDTVDDLAFCIADLIEREFPTHAALVGADLGGWIAIETVIRAYPLTDRLVLIGAPGFYLDGHRPADPFFMTAEEQTELFFVAPDAAPDVSEETAARNAAMAARLAWRPRYHAPKLLTRAHRVRTPVLVLWGGHDRFLGPDYGRAVSTILRARFVEISGTGHFPALEAPKATAEAITQFVSDAG